jgi:hypothetical protein
VLFAPNRRLHGIRSSYTLSFGGSSSAIKQNFANFDGKFATNSMTLACWLRVPTSGLSTNSVLFSIFDTGSGDYSFFGTNTSGVNWRHGTHNSSIISFGGQTNGAYYFCALTGGASNQIAYYRQQSTGFTSDSLANIGARQNADIRIGNDQNGAVSWAGGVWHIKMWNRVLSQQDLFAESLQLAPVSQRGLVGYVIPNAIGNAVDQVRGVLWTKTGSPTVDVQPPPVPEVLKPKAFFFNTQPSTAPTVGQVPYGGVSLPLGLAWPGVQLPALVGAGIQRPAALPVSVPTQWPLSYPDFFPLAAERMTGGYDFVSFSPAPERTLPMSCQVYPERIDRAASTVGIYWQDDDYLPQRPEQTQSRAFTSYQDVLIPPPGRGGYWDRSMQPEQAQSRAHTSYPERIDRPAPRALTDVGIFSPAPEQTVSRATTVYPERIDRPPPRSDFVEQPAAPERTAPLAAASFPEVFPRPLPRSDYAEVPSQPERTSPLAAQSYPDGFPRPPPRADLAVMPPLDRTSPLVATSYPDRIDRPAATQQEPLAARPVLPPTVAIAPIQFPESYPDPRGADHREWLAATPISAPIRPEVTLPQVPTSYPDPQPKPPFLGQLASAALPLAPERKAPLAAQSYPERLDRPPSTQPLHTAILAPAPERTAPPAFTHYPDVLLSAAPLRADFAEQPILERRAPYAAQSYPDAFARAVAAIENIGLPQRVAVPTQFPTSYPDTVRGPTHLEWRELQSEPWSPQKPPLVVVPLITSPSFPDRLQPSLAFEHWHAYQWIGEVPEPPQPPPPVLSAACLNIIQSDRVGIVLTAADKVGIKIAMFDKIAINIKLGLC